MPSVIAQGLKSYIRKPLWAYIAARQSPVLGKPNSHERCSAVLCCADSATVLQVWYQFDLVPVHKDMLEETEELEGKGSYFWHWHVRGLEHMNHYFSQVMKLGNRLGKKLGKKLDGDPRKASFGGYMVGWPTAPLPVRKFCKTCSLCPFSCDHHRDNAEQVNRGVDSGSPCA